MAELGSLVKTHGVRGALVLRVDKGYKPSLLRNTPWIFLEIQGKPVPFKVADCQETDGQDVILSFDAIHTKNEAEELLNHKLLIKYQSKLQESKLPKPQTLIGYTVFDDGKSKGEILDLEWAGNQPMFDLGNDRLVPVHEDLIASIDHEQKVIYMNLPEGLIE